MPVKKQQAPPAEPPKSSSSEHESSSGSVSAEVKAQLANASKIKKGKPCFFLTLHRRALK
jgi:hypothetical protein